MEKTIFQKIIDKEIPARIIYENDDACAFLDANPQAPVHVLVVPKKPYPRMSEVPASEEALLGKLFAAAIHVAKLYKLQDRGFRVVINNGPDAGETVPHLHIHILGGRKMTWPPG